MPVHSAGLLLYRRRAVGLEVFLVHPGGPYWARRDDGAWSLPKGIIDPGEDGLAAARREFKEETGFEARGRYHDLGTFRLPGGKRLSVWAVAGDCNPSKLVSNSFEMIWPPRSGRTQRFPEVDRGAWFAHPQALAKVTKGQRPVVEVFFEAFESSFA